MVDAILNGPGLEEADVKTTKVLMWLLILGMLWAVAEIFGENLLADLGIGGDASLWLAGWALLLLGMLRGVWNKIGSSSIIALSVALLKFVCISTNYCHLLGIVSLGLVFDLFASNVLTRERNQWWRLTLVGACTAYGARVFFVLYSIHVAHFERWVDGGLQMALEHVVQSGSLVAIAALFLVPLGFRIGEKAAGMGSKVLVDHDVFPAGEH